MELGPFGIWAGQFRTGVHEEALLAARELESLGAGALWIPGGGDSVILDVVAGLLAGTERLVLASGILNIWMHDPTAVAAEDHDLRTRYPERFLLGLGVSHAPMVEATNQRYERPRAHMEAFLDALDAAPVPVPKEARALAALGPRMLELAATRSAGAHPYCVPVEHTEIARATLGPGPLLAPELKAVLSTDPTTARAIARSHLGRYLASPNYANNLLRLGWGEDDLADHGSDRLVDALVAWGTPEDVAARAREHRSAGADHVCVQVLTEDPARFPIEEWRELLPALG